MHSELVIGIGNDSSTDKSQSLQIENISSVYDEGVSILNSYRNCKRETIVRVYTEHNRTPARPQDYRNINA